MVARKSVCLRRLAGGRRRDVVGFGRFLDNPRVSVEALIDGWGETAGNGCEGRQVLAIQDLSEINFRTRPEDRRGLGKIGKGGGHGLLLHAMLAVDAESGGLLGLVSGRIWTRNGLVEIPHAQRPLAQKESERWLSTAQAAKAVLAKAACVTVIADRESDIYDEWARLPEAGFHLLTRAMSDRRIEGGKLSTAALTAGPLADLALPPRPGRPARTARLRLRFGRVRIKRPNNIGDKSLPESVELSLVEVAEIDAPAGVEPLLWRLLTTHELADAQAAWRIVDWYKRRWLIEQLFRTLKQQGLQLEDSQLADAQRLIKLTAVATQAACQILQLVQARDGQTIEPASLAFSPAEIETLDALLPELEGKTAAQKNPHPKRSLAWAAWIIAKLGGWDGYASSKPPGPITFRHGLEHFRSIAYGWSLRDL
ncbi:MAG: IS4 family transposase [Actinobacteria bacterium]|nr:IS4 family transposase [Actinomycetota bacterium]